MTQALDWGVPDWLRPQDYPNPQGRFARMRWAWEFLRRNPDFREFWLTKVEPFIAAEVGIGENRWRSWRYYPELRDRFGIVDLRSPREADSVPGFSDCVTEYYPASALLREVAQPPLVPFSEHAIAVVIEPLLPIDGQLAVIKKLIVDVRRSLRKPSRRAAKASDAYRTYLRILDAEDAEVRASAIAEALFPGKDNDYSTGRRRSKAFDNARAEARRLRAGGYRALALLPLK